MAHVCNLITWKAQAGDYEFKVIFCYIRSLRLYTRLCQEHNKKIK